MFSVAKSNNRREIKIVVTGGLGDCLLATPFIRHFRFCGKYDKISCVVSKRSAEIFDQNPHIDQLIRCTGDEIFLWAAPEVDCDVFSPYIDVSAPERVGPNMNIPISSLLKPNQVLRPIVRQVAEYHGIKLKDEKPEIFTTEEDEKWGEEYVRCWKGRQVILLNLCSMLPQKSIPRALGQDIVDRLSERFAFIQLAGDIPQLSGTSIVWPLPSVRKSAALFRRLYRVITIDSFPGHLAYAVGTKAIVLFGPTNPMAFGHEENDNIRASQCPPCADTSRREECLKPTCLEEISVDRVIEAVQL